VSAGFDPAADADPGDEQASAGRSHAPGQLARAMPTRDVLPPADDAPRRAAPGPDASVPGCDASPRSGADASRSDRDASAPAGRERVALARRETRRICAWCSGPIPAAARRDAVCCSKRCRQARHRFLRAVGRASAAGSLPLRLAYADPPYPGKARIYRDHPDYAGEVDHAALIRRLSTYDGWALSTSAAALPAVLGLCPPGVRVAAWHRGNALPPAGSPLNAWEPVIYDGGRPADPSFLQERRVDSLVHGVSPLTTLPGRVTGTKPAAFCRWIFTLLGAGPGDTLDDLFPGSGTVARAWAAFTSADASRTDHDASRTDRAENMSRTDRDASAEVLHPRPLPGSRPAMPGPKGMP
jgi:hypothetical protein